MYPPEYVSHAVANPMVNAAVRHGASTHTEITLCLRRFLAVGCYVQVDQIAIEEMSLTVPPGRTHMYYTGVLKTHVLTFCEEFLEKRKFCAKNLRSGQVCQSSSSEMECR